MGGWCNHNSGLRSQGISEIGRDVSVMMKGGMDDVPKEDQNAERNGINDVEDWG